MPDDGPDIGKWPDRPTLPETLEPHEEELENLPEDEEYPWDPFDDPYELPLVDDGDPTSWPPTLPPFWEPPGPMGPFVGRGGGGFPSGGGGFPGHPGGASDGGESRDVTKKRVETAAMLWRTLSGRLADLWLRLQRGAARRGTSITQVPRTRDVKKKNDAISAGGTRLELAFRMVFARSLRASGDSDAKKKELLDLVGESGRCNLPLAGLLAALAPRTDNHMDWLLYDRAKAALSDAEKPK